MKRTSRKIWSERVRRWKASGLTAKKFAARHGFSAERLYHWSSRLGREERGGEAARAPAVPPVVEIVGTAGVLPVVPSEVAPEPFEVFLGDRVRIRVPARFDAAALCRLLDTLERR